MKRIFENIFDEVENEDKFDIETEFTDDIELSLVSILGNYNMEEVIERLCSVIEHTNTVDDYIVEDKKTIHDEIYKVIRISGFFDYKNAMRVL